MLTNPRTCRTLIVGAGPAGTSPLIYAAKTDRLARFLNLGVAIVEKGNQVGCGSIGQYSLDSNSQAQSVLECLQGIELNGILGAVSASEDTRALANYQASPAPLTLIARFLHTLGRSLQGVIHSHPHSRFHERTRALSIALSRDGTIATRVSGYTAAGRIEERCIRSETVVLAMGGTQASYNAGGMAAMLDVDRSTLADKLLVSDIALRSHGTQTMVSHLKAAGSKTVLILGGSHSAFSVASRILNDVQVLIRRDLKVVIAHRNDVRLFYDSTESAKSDGYRVTESDVCPVTHRVNRLGGLRYREKELFKRVTAGAETRVQLVRLENPIAREHEVIRSLFPESGLIIPACGYTFNMIPIYGSDGDRIHLSSDAASDLPLVDCKGRVLSSSLEPIPGVFAIGLGSGYRPAGKLGGEPAFKGQADGIWLYQNAIGPIILDQIS